MIASALLLSGCNSSDHKEEAESATELRINQQSRGVIDEIGQVDWAHYKVGEEDAILSVNLTNNTLRPDIELLATVFKEDENGDLVRLYADHALDGAQQATDIEMNLHVEANSDIYISVRDLLDDEATDNPYFLTLNLSEADVNIGTFADALPLVIDETYNCPQQKIESIGDVDSYQFTVTDAGIYKINSLFNESQGTSSVDLYLKLYSSDGSLVDSIQKEVDNNFTMIRYFQPGDYYLLAQDFGANDADSASFYTTCLTSVNSLELTSNDDASSATVLTDVGGVLTASGSLDHLSDQDWYQVPVTASDTADLQVIDLTFSTAISNVLRAYLIEIVDANGQVIFSHEHNAISGDYHVEMKVDGSDYFLKVSSEADEVFTESAPYSASITVSNVSDSAEVGETNDTINSPISLSPMSTDTTGWIEGKIAYKGDDDWYSVTVNRAEYQILEVYLETDAASEVDYNVAIIRDGMDQSINDDNGADGPTSLKTSLLIEPVDENDLESPEIVTYYIKVSDAQSSDSDADNSYRIRTNVLDIPAALPTNADITTPVSYFNEALEQTDDSAQAVTLQYNSNDIGDVKANTQLLDFDGIAPLGNFTKTQDGITTTFTSEWVAGYIDYLGDEDWFQVDLGAIYVAPIMNQLTGELEEQLQDTSWYYDIKVEFYTAEPGSSVEYIWKFYKDGQQNFILNDAQTTNSDGFFASSGDQTTTAEGYSLTTPGPEESFWLNQEWEGHFFFSVSDFNLIAAKDAAGNAVPDDDWGYDQPYYFRMTLVYHSGVENAEEAAEL